MLNNTNKWVWSIINIINYHSLFIVFSNNEWTVPNILNSENMKNTARYNKLILDRLPEYKTEQQQQQQKQQLVIGREYKQQLLEEDRDLEVCNYKYNIVLHVVRLK